MSIVCRLRKREAEHLELLTNNRVYHLMFMRFVPYERFGRVE
jgi:hypothetical protein